MAKISWTHGQPRPCTDTCCLCRQCDWYLKALAAAAARYAAGKGGG